MFFRMLKNSNYILYFFKIPTVRPSTLYSITTNYTFSIFRRFFFKPRKFKFKRFLKNFISLARLFSKAKSVQTQPAFDNTDKLIRLQRRARFRKNKKYLTRLSLVGKNLVKSVYKNIRFRRLIRFNTIYPNNKGASSFKGTSVLFTPRDLKTILYNKRSLVRSIYSGVRIFKGSLRSLRKKKFLKRKLRFFKFRYKKQVSRKQFFLKNKRIFRGQSFNDSIVSYCLFNKYTRRTYN